MNVFVAGASGALGRQLVPQLVAAGHDVVGMTRSPGKTAMLRALGARPVVADALDPDAVGRAVAEAEPDVIVHQLTALSVVPGLRDLRNPDRVAAMNNRLRTEGTNHLPLTGRVRVARTMLAWVRPPRPASAASRCARSRSTASPVRWCSTPRSA